MTEKRRSVLMIDKNEVKTIYSSRLFLQYLTSKRNSKQTVERVRRDLWGTDIERDEC